MSPKKILWALVLILGIGCLVAAGYVFYNGESREEEAKTYSDAVATAFIAQLPEAQEKPQEHHPLVEAELEKNQLDTAEETQFAPKVEIQGESYTCLLSIPTLGLALPVFHSCNDAQLTLTPCVFSGTIETNSLIIGGHNYMAHFGTLTKLVAGDTVTLIDGLGKIHQYAFTQVETISGTDLEGLKAGKWDLTLFSCVYGDNAHRLVYRFDRVTE